MCPKIGAGTAPRTDGYGMGPGCPSTVNVVLGVPNDDCAIRSKRVSCMSRCPAHCGYGQSVSVRMVASESAGGKMRRETGTAQLVFGHRLDVSRNQPQMDVVVIVKAGEQVVHAGKALDVVGPDRLLGALDIRLDHLVEYSIGVRDAACVENVPKDGGIGSS